MDNILSLLFGSNLNSEIVWSPQMQKLNIQKHNHKAKQKRQEKSQQEQITPPQRELLTLRAKTKIPNSILQTPLAA